MKKVQIQPYGYQSFFTPFTIVEPTVRSTFATSPSTLIYDHALDGRISCLESGFSTLDARVASLESVPAPIIGLSIETLPGFALKTPLSAILEPDSEGFIARAVDLPLYGYGDDSLEAIDNLKIEIASLYHDLLEDDEFTDEWLRIKAFLISKIEG